ncbi:hypothetical protein DPEC_G00099920 [Dallia pectoralis]|uniref:Uncharacterized protein n=1 Tax=Dallia pectoralis TaxID=75939 RepID=A0ACC2GX49_DALPE|nr:hypothetical protein DPEC_G00099920 [Dallia pectoralis]
MQRPCFALKTLTFHSESTAAGCDFKENFRHSLIEVLPARRATGAPKALLASSEEETDIEGDVLPPTPPEAFVSKKVWGAGEARTKNKRTSRSPRISQRRSRSPHVSQRFFWRDVFFQIFF